MPINKKTLLALGIAAAIGGGVLAAFTGTMATPPAAESAETTPEGAEKISLDAATFDDAFKAEVAAVVIDVEKIMADRVLGDTAAPLKIAEFASLTCGHCAHFHKDVVPTFKKEYVDTGKAYIVFSDFPLNRPALHASLTARCLPEGSDYFAFVQNLFEKQDDWAFSADYLDYLYARASEQGVSKAQFVACVSNPDLEKKFAEKLQAAQQQFGIDSTPSFVLNNKHKIAGAANFELFEKNIKDALAGVDAGAEATPQ